MSVSDAFCRLVSINKRKKIKLTAFLYVYGVWELYYRGEQKKNHHEVFASSLSLVFDELGNFTFC